MADLSPLQPREFFRGVWTGAGELIPHPLLRWIAPKQPVHMTSTPTWLSDTVWVVHDRFVFSSGQVIDRKMFAELVAPDRIHITADDIPGGADIQLHEHGFRFTPYYVCTRHRGIPLRLRCIDDNRIDAAGAIHDVVRMSFCGLPVATLRIGPIERKP
jgi:hypothetical protein